MFLPLERIQLISIVLSLCFTFFVFHLTRKKKIQEAYSILWFLSAFVFLLLSIWRGALDYFAALFGIFYPPSLLLLGFIFFVLLVLIQFSVAITKQNDQIKNISQQIALLQQEKNKEREE